MPEAGCSNEREITVKQSVLHLLHELNDVQKAAELVTALVAHHAPGLTSWVDNLLVQRGVVKRRHSENRASSVTPESQFRTIFGVSPRVTPAPVVAPLATSPTSKTPSLRVDPEVGRLAIVLHVAPHLRLWLIGREIVRAGNGSGAVDTSEFRQAVASWGVKYSSRHLRRLLSAGNGVFWNLGRDRVYLRSWTFVARSLAQTAQRQRCGRLERNRPGRREVYVPGTGTSQQWEANLYAGWLLSRNNPTISRSELQALFGREKTTLLRWERENLVGTVTTRSNFAQCSDWQKFYDYVPAHAQSYTALVRFKGRIVRVNRIRWQLPNTYQINGLREHHRLGQALKVRKAVNAELSLPATSRRGGLLKLYFDCPQDLRRLVRKAPDIGARYVWRGEDRQGQGTFEINENGIPETAAGERFCKGQGRTGQREKMRGHFYYPHKAFK